MIGSSTEAGKFMVYPGAPIDARLMKPEIKKRAWLLLEVLTLWLSSLFIYQTIVADPRYAPDGWVENAAKTNEVTEGTIEGWAGQWDED